MSRAGLDLQTKRLVPDSSTAPGAAEKDRAAKATPIRRPRAAGRAPVESRLSRVHQETIAPTDALLADIALLARRYVAVQKFRLMCLNQLKALKRHELDDGWTIHLIPFLDAVEGQERAFQADLRGKVREHWIWPWAKDVRGIGTTTLGRLLATTGDLGGGRASCPEGCLAREKDKHHRHRGFPTVAALWKFCGLTPGAQHMRGKKSAYSPSARTACYLIGEAMNKIGGGYKDLYYMPRRLAVLARPRIGPSSCPFGSEHVGDERSRDPETGWNRKTGRRRSIQCVNDKPHVHKTRKSGVAVEKPCTEVHSAHVHADARRYMVKKFLRDLWVEWRRRRADN